MTPTEDKNQFVKKMIEHVSKLVLNDNPIDTLIEIQNYMIDKQAQDERWQALTEDGRQARIASYKELLKLQKEEADSYLITIEDLEKLYGSHNLNPKPQIKTWDDVEKECGDILNTDIIDGEYLRSEFVNLNLSVVHFTEKIVDKCIATLKIAKLIELGYGGIVSKKEWKLSTSYIKETVLWTIVCEYKTECKEPQFRIGANWAAPDLLSFHTKQQAEEFLSQESNRQLVQQYYLM